MTKILVCQHVAFEILGTLNPLLKRAGVRIRYVNFGRHPDAQPSLDGYDGLIILGGPMSVYDVANHPHLDTEVRMINDAMERGIPVLGICLGAQLIARALGARVEPNSEKEIGWYDVRFSDQGREDPLFAHCEDSERIFQWHGDAFELPRGAVHLASTSDCDNQAFRYGSNVYGFQFRSRRKDVIRLILAEGPRFPKLAEFYYREVIARVLPVIRARLTLAVERGELAHDALARFPQLLVAPALLAVLWSGLFGRFAPLDARELMRAHLDLLFGKGGAPKGGAP